MKKNKNQKNSELKQNISKIKQSFKQYSAESKQKNNDYGIQETTYQFKNTSKINTKKPKRFYSRWEFWVILILAILSVAPIGNFNLSNNKIFRPESSSSSRISVNKKSTADLSEDIKKMAKNGYSEHEVSKYLKMSSSGYTSEDIKAALKKANVNWNDAALVTAQQFIKENGNSKERLYKLLTYKTGSKFTPSQAKYAINHIKVDWNNMALKVAQSHVNGYKYIYSKKDLYSLLSSKEYYKFKPSEAKYAVDNVKVDWNKMALMKAKEYKKYSVKDIKYTMKHDRYPFTDSEINYAVKHLK